MTAETLKEIADLLKNILVFETKFKEEILAKAEDLSGVRLEELKNILLEVDGWQKKVLTKMIKENPSFYNKIANARKKAYQEIISLYKQKLNEEDHKKMEIILDKIKII
jgi:hypothetical protein